LKSFLFGDTFSKIEKKDLKMENNNFRVSQLLSSEESLMSSVACLMSIDNYWDTGQLKKLEYPNGVKEQYKLTSRKFIDIVTDSSGNNQLFKSDYKYNEIGDRDTLIFKLTRSGPVAPITGTIAYKYDDLRRVTEAKYPRSIYNKTNKYTYDKAGNRKWYYS